jgi:hypothetical protein
MAAGSASALEQWDVAGASQNDHQFPAAQPEVLRWRTFIANPFKRMSFQQDIDAAHRQAGPDRI